MPIGTDSDSDGNWTVMLTLHMSPCWFAYIAVQLECVLTEEDSRQVLMFLETQYESQRFVAFKTNVKKKYLCFGNKSALAEWNLRQPNRPCPYDLHYHILLYVCTHTVDG